MKEENDSFVFETKREKIILTNKDYNIDKHQSGFYIYIKDNNKLEEIKKLIYPVIKFYQKKEKKIAKGNDILNSSVPKNCDYFYATIDSKITIVDSKISLILNPKQ